MHLFRLLLNEQNFNRPSIEIALELIHISSGWRGEEKYVEFGLPEVCDPRPDIDYDANTFAPIKVDLRYDSRFSGTTGFLYRRLSLDELIESQEVKVWPEQYPFKTSEVLDQINEQLHTQMTMEDLLEVQYDEPGNFTLFAHNHSLVWTGKKAFRAMNPGDPEYLFPTRILSGFVEVNL
ncbi:MAG: hypothetical protein M0R77_01225 [Gammaproteobacteria bacterium]|nr:hypothetical protein [Acholeplasmataceae bacterium]MCK9529178.1 hypothetical protein [Gammaproteobacteria bacterium]